MFSKNIHYKLAVSICSLFHTKYSLHCSLIGKEIIEKLYKKRDCGRSVSVVCALLLETISCRDLQRAIGDELPNRRVGITVDHGKVSDNSPGQAGYSFGVCGHYISCQAQGQLC